MNGWKIADRVVISITISLSSLAALHHFVPKHLSKAASDQILAAAGLLVICYLWHRYEEGPR